MKKSISELWIYRELLVALTLREIRVRYKQTFLGATWAILQPAALTIIFTLIFGLILKVNSGTVPYPIFAYSALLPWTFFSTAVTFGSMSVVNNSGLVTKVYFPRAILPLSAVGAAFFDFIMASIVIIPLFVIFKIVPTVMIIYLLVLIPSLLIFTIGVVMFLSAINVLFRDIKFVIPLLLQVWFYLTPIIYSQNQIPQKYQIYFLLNPLTAQIESFRKILVLGEAPNTMHILYSVLFSLVIFIAGYSFFRIKERVFADVI